MTAAALPWQSPDYTEALFPLPDWFLADHGPVERLLRWEKSMFGVDAQFVGAALNPESRVWLHSDVLKWLRHVLHETLREPERWKFVVVNGLEGPLVSVFYDERLLFSAQPSTDLMLGKSPTGA